MRDTELWLVLAVYFWYHKDTTVVLERYDEGGDSR